MRVQVGGRQRCRVRVRVRGLLRIGARIESGLVLGMGTVAGPG